MNLFNQVQKYIEKHSLLDHHAKIVIGLSGGPDSVFLFHFLASLHHKGNISLHAAHLDHEWRQESYKDAQFCQKLAQKVDIPFVTSQLSQLSVNFKHNGSREEYARTARRYFLEKTAQELGATHIALAHHVQDQEETFFIRLIRGSSLTGLTVMKPCTTIVKGTQSIQYIRPLLEINKAEIVTWLANNQYEYVIDQTNESPHYLRNRIRKALSLLRESDNRFDSNFVITLQRLADTERFLEKVAQTTFAAVAHHVANRWIIHIPQFLHCEPVLRYRILMHWFIVEKLPFSATQAFLDEIVRFMQNGDGGIHMVHEKWAIVKKQQTAFIEKK